MEQCLLTDKYNQNNRKSFMNMQWMSCEYNRHLKTIQQNWEVKQFKLTLLVSKMTVAVHKCECYK